MREVLAGLADVSARPRSGKWDLLHTTGGQPFYAWKWIVPRINDDLLDCVVYLYPSVEDAKNGERAGGSGFLLGVPSKIVPNKQWIYAVTNKHVVRDAASPVVRLNTADGDTDVWPLTCDHWLPHPDGDDLAVTLLPGLTGRHKWKAVDVGMLVTKDDLKKHNIGPGDDVVMVGRFIAHDGTQRNTPSARFGNISMMPEEPIPHPCGHFQESFVIETRSLGGFSGSPVFTIQPAPPRGTVMLTSAEKERMPDFLLGVDWGHLHIREDVHRKDGKHWPWALEVRSNSGQMGVVPAWRLRQLLEVEELVKKREEGERIFKKLLEQAATLDAVKKDPQPGPEPERLKIDDAMDEAVKKMFEAGKPPRPS